MKTLVVAALLLVLLEPAWSSAQPTYTAYGHGVSSCGTWRARREKGQEHTVDQSWVLGFLSGVAAVGRPMRDTDPNAIDAWMDDYCAAHPLDAIAEASSALVQALDRK